MIYDSDLATATRHFERALQLEPANTEIIVGAAGLTSALGRPNEAIALAARKQVALSMDVYNGTYIAEVGPGLGYPEEFIRKNNETTEAQRQVFTKAYESGVPIIFGTDSGVYPHGDNAKQFVVMVQRGMSPMDAIKAATSVAARYIGWGKDVGSIAEGRFGDIVAVRGDPLSNISVLQDIDVVVKGGLVFKQDD